MILNWKELGALFGDFSVKDLPLTGVCTDSRNIEPGNLFIALQGEKFDGHHFVQEAIQRGAVAALVSRPIETQGIEQMMVPDTLLGLGHIAQYYRNKFSCPVIALTGSNGKTSVKEMIASILPKPSHSTPGNLNNHIGVPLSIFKLKPEHRYAVFELGASHAGEIAYTVKIVQPQVTLINNIAPAHVEGFGSIDGVADAKGEIHQGLKNDGIAIVNEDDAYAHYWDELLAGKQVIRFSREQETEVHAKKIHSGQDEKPCFTLVTPRGEKFIRLQVPGIHNVSNSLAAASAALAVGLSLEEIVRGLETFTGVAGRMTFRTGKNHSLIIDDTYNANLKSTLTALEVLAQREGQRIFVFGDMGELGDWSHAHHEEVGKMARNHGIDALFTCGSLSQLTADAFGKGKHYQSQEALVEDLLTHLDEKTTVLVKGSRSAGMEKIVQRLLAPN